jgi:hypothetical protein
MLNHETEPMNIDGKLVADPPNHKRTQRVVGATVQPDQQPTDTQENGKQWIASFNRRGLTHRSADLDPSLRHISVVLATLVFMCLVMAVFVWWRLLV